MPRIDIDGVEIHYEEKGQGPETIVFAHGLLWSGRMFDEQVQALCETYRCITFDFRGQGRSEVAAEGYDMDRLTLDTARLIEALDCAPCHFVGLSMGGFVGMRLAIRRPELLQSLMLVNTSADTEPPWQAKRYRWLSFVARWFGLSIVAHRAMSVMFGPKFLSDPARVDQRKKWRAELLNNHRIGVTRAVKGVVDRSGVHDQLDRITVPTLVVVGERDVATPPGVGQRIHEGVCRSRLVTIPDAGHTSTVEEPQAVTAAVTEFLNYVYVSTIGNGANQPMTPVGRRPNR
jgi:pimeloyl-ACP methyl ester carboxylesterase